MTEYQKLQNYAAKHLDDFAVWNALFEYSRTVELSEAKPVVKTVQKNVLKQTHATGRGDWFELYHRATIFRGAYDFDSYMLACEWKREKKARFWLPRRSVLEDKHKIASQIQAFIDDPDALFLGFSMPPGTGKALADDTPVLTRNGWIKHGELVVGDEVISLDGKFVKVTHVHPKVSVNCEITFTNGQKVICHENHEWLVYDRRQSKERLLETKLLESQVIHGGAEVGRRGHRYHIQLPHKNPIVGECKELPVAPYTFGAWLGDGRNGNPDICGDAADNAVIDGVLADGYEISWQSTHNSTGVKYYGFKNLRSPLQDLGFCHSRRRVEKFIPDMYLTASTKQRLQLLAGLLDTDGTCMKAEGKYRFTTTEEKLKDSFIALVSTFGWRCSVTEVQPTVSSSGIVGKHIYWVVQFNPTLDIPCRLERKRLPKLSKARRIAVQSIRRCEPQLGNCITVEGGLYLVGQTLIPTHNSTLIKFLLAYISGRWPKSANMYVSYADGMVKMMFDSVKAITTDTTEYSHYDVFPELKAPDCSAEYATISHRRKGDFPTIGMVSLSGSVTGRTRANKFLVTDDLVKNAEMARSPERLFKLNADYRSTLTTRMIGDNVKQVMLGTIWSLHDPISKMKADHADDPRYRFIAIPVWDENEQSNFEFDHEDKYTHDSIQAVRSGLEPTDFSALYLQAPMEKEGLAFSPDSLRYYSGVLPDGEPDNVLFFADIAWGGGDSCSAPFAYVYGGDVYIHDVLFDRGDKFVTKPRMVGKIIANKVRMGRGEANNGGDEYIDDISKMLREKNYSCNLGHKKAPSNMSKLSRIEQHSPVIRTFYFRDDKHRDAEYRRFMNELTSFSFTAKNLHDDAADSLAGLVDYFSTGIHKAQVFVRPF